MGINLSFRKSSTILIIFVHCRCGLVCNSYTMPTRAVWDLLPEPEGEGNKSHAARGGVV